MSNNTNKTTEVAQHFGSTIKEILSEGKSTWSSHESAHAGLKLLRTLNDQSGEPVKLNDEHVASIRRIFNPRQCQMAALDHALKEANCVLEGERRELIERLLDPAMFRQELVANGLIEPARKKRKTALADLLA